MENNTVSQTADSAADIPNGGVQALTTAATGSLALEIAFLGYWGFGAHAKVLPWHWLLALVFAAFLTAFFCLAGVAWLVTQPGLTVQVYAQGRRRYLWGVTALALGVFLAVSVSLFSLV